MTRRSAFALAGGVVAALGAGIVATIVNVGVLNASEPQGPGQLRAEEPVVRTVTETKTVHKKEGSSASSGGVTVISRPGRTPSRSNGVASASDENSNEDDEAYEEDENYEGEWESEDDHEESEDEEHEFDEDDDD